MTRVFQSAMKHNILIFCAVFGLAAGLSAQQVEIKLPYRPSASDPAPAPVMHSMPASPAPLQAVSAAPTATSGQDAAARRAAALAKVQGKQAPAPVASPAAASAKSVAPATYSTSSVVSPVYEPDPATTVTVNGLNVQRTVRPGRGQVGNELFTPVSELHFVQFAVYCKDTPVDKAPPIEGLYLLWHPGSTCPEGAKGASYIVKGYNSAEEAKAAVAAFRARGVECWYNPALTGAEVEIIGVR